SILQAVHPARRYYERSETDLSHSFIYKIQFSQYEVNNLRSGVYKMFIVYGFGLNTICEIIDIGFCFYVTYIPTNILIVLLPQTLFLTLQQNLQSHLIPLSFSEFEPRCAELVQSDKDLKRKKLG